MIVINTQTNEQTKKMLKTTKRWRWRWCTDGRVGHAPESQVAGSVAVEYLASVVRFRPGTL